MERSGSVEFGDRFETSQSKSPGQTPASVLIDQHRKPSHELKLPWGSHPAGSRAQRGPRGNRGAIRGCVILVVAKHREPDLVGQCGDH